MNTRRILKDFIREHMNNVCPLKIPAGASRMLNGSTEFVLYRDGPIQIELITLLRGSHIPRHCHPNIDTYEIIIGGGDFASALVGDRWHHKGHKDRIVLIEAGVYHEASVDMNVDTALLSVQYWRNSIPPTFITDDWIGGDWK